jgi:hypothetical protein
MTFTLRQDNLNGLLKATNGRPHAMSGLEVSIRCTDTDCNLRPWNNPG